LRLDLGSELAARTAPQEDLDSRPRQIAAQAPATVHEIRNAFGRKRGRAVDEDEVQTHAQRRQAAGSRDGVARCGAAYHQACRRQDALRVRQLDGFVDFRRGAEIVRRDDQRFQCAASLRSRRK
jgi:hypothetical protein